MAGAASANIPAAYSEPTMRLGDVLQLQSTRAVDVASTVKEVTDAATVLATSNHDAEMHRGNIG